jgi:UDP-N-acetylglucosamine diphosphorylase/glucosamine-1-phosphate N-acetyltransferase
MNIILFDPPITRTNLLPFTFTRPVSEIRIGILTIKEKWRKWLPADYSYLTEDYLSKKFASHRTAENLYLNGSILPDSALVDAVKALKKDQVLLQDNLPIAFYGNLDSIKELDSEKLTQNKKKVFISSEFISIQNVYDIFIHNGAALRSDYNLLTKGRKSHPIEDRHTAVYNPQDIFIEENVNIKSAILNAENGPIYVAANAEIGEGSIIKGAASIGEHAVLNLGARLRGDITIGPRSKVGGEISNSVIFGNSNKAHDGFLGNSVLGEWCNIGADTNASNLKNNYENVRIWNYAEERFAQTGRQFCGLMMGDHSKCGINTMFNTGTVVGVSSNVFGGGYPRTFIPSFSEGGAQGLKTYNLKKAMEVIRKVYERRKKTFLEEEVEILVHIFEKTKKYRPK